MVSTSWSISKMESPTWWELVDAETERDQIVSLPSIVALAHCRRTSVIEQTDPNQSDNRPLNGGDDQQLSRYTVPPDHWSRCDRELS